MKKSSPKKNSAAYSITLTFGGKQYKGSGSSPGEALASLERPPKLMAKGLVAVEYDGLKKQMLMSPVQLKRLFYNSPGIAAVKAKQIFMLMK
jgi:hypothetical protein